MLTIQVINKPGVANDMLLALSPEEATLAVFTAGTRLHCDDLTAAISSGDGGWIISKCASTLGGEVNISFGEEHTIFTLTCPVHLSSVLLQKTSTSGECEWTVPPNTWGHAVDDSKVQRKILRKIFQMIGVPDTRMVITGESFAECAKFSRATEEHIKLHPEDMHLVIADEYLDSQDDESVLPALERASGSCSIEVLLKSLKVSGALADQVLALVRSANDSGEDVTLYHSRAHGFFPKEIVRRNDVLRVLEPLWLKRFGQNQNT